MNKHAFFILAATISFAAFPLAAEEKLAQPNDFIDVFAKLSGDNKGIRKNHAKGICATGDFTPSRAGAEYFDADVFSGTTIPVVYRFSLPGGNPMTPDNARAPRGFAAQFSLPDGSKHNIATLNVPVFAAKDPDTFLGLLQASVPTADGKPDTVKLANFKAEHPDTKPLEQWLGSHQPPYSYATAEYFGIHTFYIRDKNGEQTKIRFQLKPQDGIKGLTDAELPDKGGDFLRQRLTERLQKGPVSFDWVVSLGQPEDSVNDPTLRWPDNRETLTIGTLRLISSGDDSCTKLNFDPNVLSRGFSASDDPVLKMRSPAYAISFGKRLSGQ